MPRLAPPGPPLWDSLCGGLYLQGDRDGVENRESCLVFVVKATGEELQTIDGAVHCLVGVGEGVELQDKSTLGMREGRGGGRRERRREGRRRGGGREGGGRGREEGRGGEEEGRKKREDESRE